jgi:hypothetical protein
MRCSTRTGRRRESWERADLRCTANVDLVPFAGRRARRRLHPEGVHGRRVALRSHPEQRGEPLAVRRPARPRDRGTLVLNPGSGARGLRLLVRLVRPLVLPPFTRQRLRRYLPTPNQAELAALAALGSSSRRGRRSPRRLRGFTRTIGRAGCRNCTPAGRVADAGMIPDGGGPESFPGARRLGGLCAFVDAVCPELHTEARSGATMCTSGRPGSPPLPGAPDHPGSPRITPDHPGSPRITPDHPGSPRITPDHPGSPRIAPSSSAAPAVTPRRVAPGS